MQELYNFTAMSVLIVDDSTFTRRLASQIFRSFGFGFVREASNCEKAFEIYTSNNIDIVCVESLMKPLSGTELIKTIRTSTESPNAVVPILSTCIHPTVRNINVARDAGASELIAKPFAPKSALERLIYMVEQPRQFVRTEDFFGPDRRRSVLDGYAGKERRVAPEDNSGDAADVAVDRAESEEQSSEVREIENAAE
jgi:two-component system chemotaxis response regulator CheY